MLELWRNKLDVGWNFIMDNTYYVVKPHGLVQIPDRFHDLPARRGYALEFVPGSAVDDDCIYFECLDPDERTPEEQLTTTLEVAEILLKKPNKPKKKSK